jgi:O-antigen/teichoic acid export membrane protein
LANEKPLGRNILYSAATAVSNVLLVALVIIAARILGARSFGNFSFALAIASIFETFIDLGSSTLIAREVARHRDRSEEYLSNILGWKLVLSAIAMAMLVITVNLLHEVREARIAAYIFGGAIVLRSYKGTSHAFFQSQERFDLLLLTTYVERILVLIGGLAALILTRSLIAFAASFALVRIPDLMFSFWLVHRQIAPVRISFNTKTIRKMQIASLPFGSYAAVGVMYSYVGTVMLSSMTDSVHVGWYSAGYKIYEGLTMFPYLVAAVLLPRLSRLYVDDPDQYASLTLRIMRYLLLVSLPLLFCIGVLAPQVIGLFYGPTYIAAVPMLRILLGAAVMMFMSTILGTALVSADREKVVLKVTCASLVVMAASNLILVHRMGAIGAAYSVLVSEFFTLGVYLASVRSGLIRVPATQITWRPLVASIVAGLAVRFSGFNSQYALAALFAGTYTVVLFALRTFDTDDWAVLKSLLLSRSESG